MTRGVGGWRGWVAGGRKRRRGCVGGYDGTPTQAPPFSSSLSSLPRALPVYPPLPATDNYALTVPLPPPPSPCLSHPRILLPSRCVYILFVSSRFSRFCVPSRRFRARPWHTMAHLVLTFAFRWWRLSREIASASRPPLAAPRPTSPPILRFSFFFFLPPRFTLSPPLTFLPLLSLLSGGGKRLFVRSFVTRRVNATQPVFAAHQPTGENRVVRVKKINEWLVCYFSFFFFTEA